MNNIIYLVGLVVVVVAEERARQAAGVGVPQAQLVVLINRHYGLAVRKPTGEQRLEFPHLPGLWVPELAPGGRQASQAVKIEELSPGMRVPATPHHGTPLSSRYILVQDDS